MGPVLLIVSGSYVTGQLLALMVSRDIALKDSLPYMRDYCSVTMTC